MGTSVVSEVSVVSVVSVGACVVSVVVTTGAEVSLVSGPMSHAAADTQTDAMSAVLTTLFNIDFFIFQPFECPIDLHANNITIF